MLRSGVQSELYAFAQSRSDCFPARQFVLEANRWRSILAKRGTYFFRNPELCGKCRVDRSGREFAAAATKSSAFGSSARARRRLKESKEISGCSCVPNIAHRAAHLIRSGRGVSDAGKVGVERSGNSLEARGWHIGVFGARAVIVLVRAGNGTGPSSRLPGRRR
jgi:hypothetical protein